MRKFKLGIVQICAKDNKDRNIKRCEELVRLAVDQGSDVVLLPEMWNCPYQNEYFPKFAEEKHGKTYKFMKDLAAELKIILVGGSIPIIEDGKIYNESFVFNKKGEEISSYKKIYMFDILFEDGKEFRESDTIEPGKTVTCFDTEYGRFGIAICYDLRFPEFFNLMHKMGAEGFFLPATFTKRTGEKHWELLLRARAVDFQSYVFGASMARDNELSSNVFGHSRIIGPGGEILASIDEKEGVITGDIDMDKVKENKKLFPIERSRISKYYRD